MISRAVGQYDAKALSIETGLVCNDPSRAIQSMRDETDINQIVRNFGVTGQLPASVRLPTYDDFAEVEDFRSALEAIRGAEASFLQVSADVRAKFDNDPQKFLEFCEDRRNLDELRKLGLAPAAEQAERSEAS